MTDGGWSWPGTQGVDLGGPAPGQGVGPGAGTYPTSVPPPAPPPSIPPPPEGHGGSGGSGAGGGAPGWVWAVAAVLFVALVAGVTWFLVDGRRGGDEVTVHLEPRAEPGPNAFTSSFATVDDGTVRGFTTVGSSDPAGAGSGGGRFALTQVPGDRSGLYGSVAGGEACDREGLAAALVADPGVAAAFAGALGISVADVAPVVHGLAPVVLGRDTAVTNHRYRDGRAEPFQAVLQAGTAVLVDALGVPRVRCACGNPLGLPRVEGRTVVLEGERWPEFSETRISSVVASVAPQPMVEAVDVETGQMVEVPVDDVLDPPPVTRDPGETSSTTGSTVVDEGSTATTEPSAPVIVGDGDGIGGTAFGSGADALVDELTGAFGPPDDDSGYETAPCETGDDSRTVRWGALSVFIARAPGDEPRLDGWLVVLVSEELPDGEPPDGEPPEEVAPDEAAPEGFEVGGEVGQASTWGDLAALGVEWTASYGGAWQYGGFVGEVDHTDDIEPPVETPIIAVGGGVTGLLGC